MIREAVIMKRQRHPHILELLAVFVDGSDLWMIIPLMPGGSLESLIKKGYPKVYFCHPLNLFRRDRTTADSVGIPQTMLTPHT